jgi:hypothetical protein
MGRGRAKAKQTKVARELKYRSTHTDFSSLERELRGDEEYQVPAAYADLVEDDEETDPDDYDEDEDEAEDYGRLRQSG